MVAYPEPESQSGIRKVQTFEIRCNQNKKMQLRRLINMIVPEWTQTKQGCTTKCKRMQTDGNDETRHANMRAVVFKGTEIHPRHSWSSTSAPALKSIHGSLAWPAEGE